MDAPSTNAPRGRRLGSAPTLRDVLGEGVVYVPRPSPAMPGWTAPARAFLDYESGEQLTIAGGAPYVASTGVVTPVALEVLAEAGVAVDAEVHPYHSLAEHPAVLRKLMDRGLRLALQRVHPAAEAPAASCSVRPALLASLNDKASVSDLVPSEWLPARRVVRLDKLPPAEKVLGQGPVVLKAAGAVPTGGGYGVWVVRTPEEFKDAREALSEERLVVVEEFLPIARSVCVHAVARPDGTVAPCGVTEEVVASAKWTGAWLDPAADDVPAPVVDTALGIVSTAAARGWRGIASVEVALLADDRSPKVIDLNFRVNASTAAAWLRAAVERERGARAIRLRRFTVRGAVFTELVRLTREAVARGSLVPLCLFDPDASATSGVPRLTALVIGPSREAVEEEERRLSSDGLL
jgi:hypothetical protein